MLTLPLMASLAGLRVGINKDKSLGGKVFLSYPSSRFNLGDYVVFPAPETPITKGKNLTFVKRIECLEGDIVIKKGREFYCLHYLGKALTHTRQGVPLSPSSFEGEIPANCYWVKGDHPRSYDSRYFGLICNPQRKALPLW